MSSTRLHHINIFFLVLIGIFLTPCTSVRCGALPENTSSEKTVLVDAVLQGTTTWQGQVRISGQVVLSAGSRLTILPGTVVEFTGKAAAGKETGGSVLLVQGTLVARGTAELPVVFRAAASGRGKGNWAGIVISSGKGGRHIFEFCRFEDAARGLFFQAAAAVVRDCVFQKNIEGVRLQGSDVELRGNTFIRNSVGILAENAKIVLAGNQFLENRSGADFQQSELIVQNNSFLGNRGLGMKVTAGLPVLTGNVFSNNLTGLMLTAADRARITGNLLVRNMENGLLVQGGSGIKISGNFVQHNGVSGITLRDTDAAVSANTVSVNGRQGIAVAAFSGTITGNNLVGNRLYAVVVRDGGVVSAAGNWYGETDGIAAFFEQENGVGKVDYQPVAKAPLPFTWPLAAVPVDVDWSGVVQVTATVSVPENTTLSIRPGTSVLFAKDAGLHVSGRLLAVGTESGRISFTALEGDQPGSWGEFRIEYSVDSRFVNCDFQYASWGIHSHFNRMLVSGCTFANSNGGIRLRDGPVFIRNSRFSDNGIGIRSFRGNAEITGNIITRNNKGIFIREKGGGLKISGNNIFANRDYNIWVGDFNTEDIDAVGNWWETGEPAETIFDARREPGIGTVHFDPVLAEPVAIKVVGQGPGKTFD